MDDLDGGPGGATVVFGGTAPLRVDLGAERVTGRGPVDRVRRFTGAVGGSADDVLLGDGRGNRLEGGAGDDRLVGGGGDDGLRGGPGRDRIAGDAGDDRINGDAGSDTTRGGDGGDELTSYAGGDRIRGGAGADEISHEGAVGAVHFGPGADEVSLYGEAVDSEFGYGPGRDRLDSFDPFDAIPGDCERFSVGNSSGLNLELLGRRRVRAFNAPGGRCRRSCAAASSGAAAPAPRRGCVRCGSRSDLRWIAVCAPPS